MDTGRASCTGHTYGRNFNQSPPGLLEKKLLSRKIETISVEWMWVTTLPCKAISTENFVDLAHHRWDIENQCFNELSTYWHADHFYKYHFNAILIIWLIIILAYNIFQMFFHRNLKNCTTKKEVLDQIKGEFLFGLTTAIRRGTSPLLRSD